MFFVLERREGRRGFSGHRMNELAIFAIRGYLRLEGCWGYGGYVRKGLGREGAGSWPGHV